jgi:hypothetical protein
MMSTSVKQPVVPEPRKIEQKGARRLREGGGKRKEAR